MDGRAGEPTRTAVFPRLLAVSKVDVGLPRSGPYELLLWLARRRILVRVRGHSMEPLLHDGAKVLVKPIRDHRALPPMLHAGMTVIARHPYVRDCVLLKQLSHITEGGRVFLRGLCETESTDSRAFGTIPVDDILGVVTSILLVPPPFG